MASSPYRSATAATFSGRKVPSVSMTATLPWAPPSSVGSWHVTHRVWQSCVFPHRYSPWISVIDWVSMPPPRMSFRAAHPVDILSTVAWRRSRHILPVMKPVVGRTFIAASIIFSTLVSLRARKQEGPGQDIAFADSMTRGRHNKERHGDGRIRHGGATRGGLTKGP